MVVSRKVRNRTAVTVASAIRGRVTLADAAPDCLMCPSAWCRGRGGGGTTHRRRISLQCQQRAEGLLRYLPGLVGLDRPTGLVLQRRRAVEQYRVGDRRPVGVGQRRRGRRVRLGGTACRRGTACGVCGRGGGRNRRRGGLVRGGV